MKAGVFKTYRNALLHLFYPRLCEVCGVDLLAGEAIICLHCYASIPATAYHNQLNNATVLRLAGRFPFSFATSYAYFVNKGIMQKLMHALKYRGNKEMGLFLGKQLGFALQKSSWGNQPELLLPVPLHKKKLRTRGYNQSELIADGIAEVLQIPVARTVLYRAVNTESQVNKSRQERIDNVKDAFSVKNIEQIKGRHVLLIDDVLTTGATIESCALALLQQADVRISIATVGIASE